MDSVVLHILLTFNLGSKTNSKVLDIQLLGWSFYPAHPVFLYQSQFSMQVS